MSGEVDLMNLTAWDSVVSDCGLGPDDAASLWDEMDRSDRFRSAVIHAAINNLRQAMASVSEDAALDTEVVLKLSDVAVLSRVMFSRLQ